MEHETKFYIYKLNLNNVGHSEYSSNMLQVWNMKRNFIYIN